jgi:transposase
MSSGRPPNFEIYTQYIRLYIGKKFGPKSERSKSADDADVSASQEAPGSVGGAEKEEPPPDLPKESVASESSPLAGARRGRKRFPDSLPRRDEVIDIPDKDKICPCCGVPKVCIGHEESERLEFAPARFFVRRYLRLKYAATCECEYMPNRQAIEGAVPSPAPPQPDAQELGPSGADMVPEVSAESDAQTPGLTVDGAAVAISAGTPLSIAQPSRLPVVSIAPPPVQLIPKGIPGISLLVHIIIAKVVDALPLYRQAAQFLRYGVTLSRSTMCGWLIKVGQLLRPVMNALRAELLAGPLIGCDETPLQVLDEPGREATAQSYVWVFRGGALDKPCVEFVYAPTRSSDVPRKYLENYRGDVQADGYGGYNFLKLWTWIILIGCWVHVRRKFMEVIKSEPPGSRVRAGVAHEAVERIGYIYRIERIADLLGLDHDERRTLRQEKAKPLLADFESWLEEVQLAVPPKCLLGKAISYALDQWPRLEHYLEAGYRRPDNNLVENLIRPFAVGRKNWLFSATPEGAAAMAAFHSLIESAKINGLDPARYLRALFDKLPYATAADDYRALLPQYIDRGLLAPDLPESTILQPAS